MIGTEDYSLKSNDFANKCRAHGNKLYCERSFFEALLKYNESLCYAENGSEGIGLAYANRSAVYFEMKSYEKCLQNIGMARVNEYPEKNFHILEKRSQKCLEMLKTEQSDMESPFDFVKLSYKENPRLPFVVNCLEMKQSKSFGRYIVATQDLNVGDILAIEEPFFKIIKSDSRYDSCPETNKYQRCSVCLKDNLMDLLPCSYCVSTMFCSQKCKDFAMRNYHNYECSIIEILLKTGIMQMAMRMFFQAVNIFSGSIDELQKFLSQNSNPTTSVYDFDFSGCDEESMAKSYLLSAYNLARNDKTSLNESPEKIFNLLPVLQQMWQEHSIFIKKFFSTILKLGDSNFHGICGWSIKKYENQEPQMIGVGCHPFISLINHSCAPNVHRMYAEGKMFIVVERPIKQGEQLFDCYRTTFFTQPKAERQEILYEDYSFLCQCEACTKNYPLFHSLKCADKKTHKWAKKCKNDILKFDTCEAKKKHQEYCKTIQSLHELNGYPSAEIVLLQECLQHCLSIIIKPKILFA